MKKISSKFFVQVIILGLSMLSLGRNVFAGNDFDFPDEFSDFSEGPSSPPLLIIFLDVLAYVAFVLAFFYVIYIFFYARHISTKRKLDKLSKLRVKGLNRFLFWLLLLIIFIMSMKVFKYFFDLKLYKIVFYE